MAGIGYGNGFLPSWRFPPTERERKKNVNRIGCPERGRDDRLANPHPSHLTALESAKVKTLDQLPGACRMNVTIW